MANSQESQPNQSSQEPSKYLSLSIFKKLIIIIVIVVVVAFIGFGIFWFLKKGKLTSNDNQNLPISNSGTIIFNTNIDVSNLNIALDSDQDGLSDLEEQQLGTNVGNKDTDYDGLFDYEEVEVYKTNPLESDSDADGVLDGDEVKNGDNPLGTGKLFDINKAIKNINNTQ